MGLPRIPRREVLRRLRASIASPGNEVLRWSVEGLPALCGFAPVRFQTRYSIGVAETMRKMSLPRAPLSAQPQPLREGTVVYEPATLRGRVWDAVDFSAWLRAEAAVRRERVRRGAAAHGFNAEQMDVAASAFEDEVLRAEVFRVWARWALGVGWVEEGRKAAPEGDGLPPLLRGEARAEIERVWAAVERRGSRGRGAFLATVAAAGEGAQAAGEALLRSWGLLRPADL